MAGAVVVYVRTVEKHPNASKLDIVTVDDYADLTQLVTGQHYFPHTLGVWFRPGYCIPGWLAQDMWLTEQDGWYEVKSVDMRGVESPGLFAGSIWQKTRTSETEKWPHWCSSWTVGDTVDGYFGIIPAR